MGHRQLADGLSVVIPTSSDEQAPYLENCLYSVAHQMGYTSSTEVIVVCLNNGTQAKNINACCARHGARVIYHKNPHESFSGALTRNVGARHARYKHLLFLDADVVIPISTFTLGTTALGTSDAAVMLVRRMKQPPHDAMYRELDPEKYRRNCYGGRLDIHGYSAVFFISSELFAMMHGFDEKFVGWGAEDTDMIHRLRNDKRRTAILTMQDEMAAMHQWHPPRAWYKQEAQEENRQKLCQGGPFIRNPQGWGGRAD
jgi:predicted glycosyltransferase involved in capsule biosynthesis